MTDAEASYLDWIKRHVASGRQARNESLLKPKDEAQGHGSMQSCRGDMIGGIKSIKVILRSYESSHSVLFGNEISCDINIRVGDRSKVQNLELEDVASSGLMRVSCTKYNVDLSWIVANGTNIVSNNWSKL